MLTKKQFDILSFLATHPGQPTQRQLAEEVRLSLGTVNHALRDLQASGLVTPERNVTPDGLRALEPYRVKRAVFYAAGFGSRMVPVTLNTPKPLVRVKGVRIIDTLLDALLAAGIEEIYIVRGYLREQFDQLLYKYPMIQFIDNPLYNETNTIGSAHCAGDRISGAYVLEADLYLKNPALIAPYQYESNFLAIPIDRTEDYFVKEKKGYISEFHLGGTDGYQMVGISYWTEADGLRLAKDIAADFSQPGGKERLWSSVSLATHASEYRIAVRPCSADDVVEIDTFNELKAIDPAYGQARKTNQPGSL